MRELWYIKRQDEGVEPNEVLRRTEAVVYKSGTPGQVLDFGQAGHVKPVHAPFLPRHSGPSWDAIGKDLNSFEISFLGLNPAQALARVAPVQFSKHGTIGHQDL